MHKYSFVAAVVALTSWSFGCAGGSTSSSQAAVCNPPPASASANALCVCGDFVSVGAGFTATPVQGASANVGVNGKAVVIGDHVIHGSMVAYGGIGGVGNLVVRDDVSSGDDVAGVGRVKVGGNLSVGGDMLNVGVLDVAGTVAVAGETTGIGWEEIGGVATYAALAGPPCGCDPSTLIDVAGTVAAAKTSGALDIDNLGETSIALKTGNYYATGIDSLGDLDISVDGNVNLYVDGDVNTVGSGSFQLTPGSTLALWISGDLHNIGALELEGGSTISIMVGGPGSVAVSVGYSEIAGNIYAPQAQVLLVGDTVIDGSLFAKNLGGVGALFIKYSPPSNSTGCTGGPVTTN